MPKIINISKQEAEAINSLPDNTVLISINDPNGEPAKLKVPDEKVLRLTFADVVENLSHKNKYYPAATSEQIRAIIDFIIDNSDKNIIVHCTAGVSRSGAVALFAHVMLGYELRENFWIGSYPNPLVLGMLVRDYSMIKDV